jgi:TRAP-type C4-dicarboxylate transport system substrate-binding protein
MLRRALLLAAAAITAATPAPAQETLRAIGFIPKNDPVLAMANTWANDVNKALAGKVRVNFVGGPEVIGRYQQGEAVRNGVIDIIFTPTTDHQDHERKSGFYALILDEMEKKLGARYLGRVQVSPFYLWVKREPKTLADLKGLKMRTGVLYDRMMREFGMVPVNINAPEVFTAIDSGVVDGFGWPATGPLKRGWLNKVGFVIDLPFFPASNVVALMSLKKWQALPKGTQDMLIETTAAFEPRMVAHFDKENEEEWKAIGDKVKKVKFSEAENKRYLDAAYELEWQQLEKRVPDLIGRLRKLSGN